jgi:hypothetical protein
MRVLMLVLTLAACYFPAVAGARGRGSRKIWILFVFLGLFISLGTMMLVKALGVPIIWISNPNAASNMFEVIIRLSIGFTFGSFLAVLLFKKKPRVEGLTLKG